MRWGEEAATWGGGSRRVLKERGFWQGNFEGFEEMYEQKRRENNKKFETFEKQMKAAKKSGSKANQDKVGGAPFTDTETPMRILFHFFLNF